MPDKPFYSLRVGFDDRYQVTTQRVITDNKPQLVVTINVPTPDALHGLARLMTEVSAGTWNGLVGKLTQAQASSIVVPTPRLPANLKEPTQ